MSHREIWCVHEACGPRLPSLVYSIYKIQSRYLLNILLILEVKLSWYSKITYQILTDPCNIKDDNLYCIQEF
jgi:hypothetical protein